MTSFNNDETALACLKAAWFKATASNGGGCCVEVCFANEMVLVRDSKWHGPPGVKRPILSIGHHAWTMFLGKIHGALPTKVDQDLSVENGDKGTVVFRSSIENDELVFLKQEWEAFKDGASKGEFNLPSRFELHHT